MVTTLIQAIAQRMNGNVIGVLGVLTTLVLACAAGVLVIDLASTPIDQPVQAASGEVVNRTLLTAALIVGLVLIAPLIGAVSLFLLLKRYGGSMGPLIHIEYGAAAPVVVGPYAAKQLGIADANLESLADAVARKRLEEQTVDTPTAEPFDFGPSFADELVVKQSLVHRQQEGVLSQLFADNLRLHENIELDKVAEKRQEAATESNQESPWQQAHAWGSGCCKVQVALTALHLRGNFWGKS